LAEDLPARLLIEIIDRVDQALMIVNTAFEAPVVLHVNHALLRLTGWTRDEVVGGPVGVLQAPETDPRVFQRLTRAIQAGSPVDLRLSVQGHGRVIEVAVSGRGAERSPGHYGLRFEPRPRPSQPAVSPDEGRRRRAALLTAEAAYHLAVGPDCGLQLDWTGGAFETLTGYRLAEIGARGGWPAIVHPADLRQIQRRGQLLLAGQAARVRYRIRRADGSLRWLVDEARPERAPEDGLITGALCVARDITALEQARRRARVLATRQQALRAVLPGLILEVDGDGRILEVSGTLESDLGRRLAGAEGCSLAEAGGPQLLQAWHQALRMRSAPASGPGLGFVHQGEHGAPEPHVVRFARTGDDHLVIGISPRAAPAPPKEPARLGQDVLVRTILNARPLPSLVLTPTRTILEVNRGAEHLLGKPRDALVGRTFPEVVPIALAEPELLNQLARAREGQTVRDVEVWQTLPSGQEGRVVWHLQPVWSNGNGACAILVSGEALGLPAPAPPGERGELRQVFDHLGEGIVTADGEGRILSFSRSAEAILGYRAEEVVGRPLASVLDLKAPGVLGASAERTLEITGLHRGGSEVPLEVTLAEIHPEGRTISIVTLRDTTIRDQTERAIRDLAYHDPLTGLPNRLLFADRISQAIERARRQGQGFAVMSLDIDRFSLINESLGLGRGDETLRLLGERLRATLRRSDTVARMGSDDFVFLLPGVNGAEGAAKVAHKLLEALMTRLRIDGQDLHLTGSVGIALYPHDGEDFETLMRNADTALYRAKERSRGSFQFYTSDMNAAAFERLILETQLRHAIDRNELVLFYQPQVRVPDGAVVGVEALIRWRHPEIGLVSPAEFIPLAEETGLILPIGRWVLHAACLQLQTWHEAGFRMLRLAVNLSGRQFQDAGLVDEVARVLSELSVDPAFLELELTESSIMRDPDTTTEKLQALRSLGVQLSIDDFGTGYSSLGHLRRFPIRTLKIDRSFVKDITTDPSNAAIARGIIALAESLQLRVVAEGVETRAQLTALMGLNCSEVQGFLFARPLPADQIVQLLRTGVRSRE
jgi:diguanylate cyclase (GGDEF)-like protein/PAS domain S-box-containing protein